MEDSQGRLIVAGPYNLNTDYGEFVARFDLSGGYIDAFKIGNTVQSPTFMSVLYNGVGRDMAEVPGQGYVYSTLFQSSVITYKQSLITMDYTGGLGCTALEGTYPFSIVNVTWTPNTFSNLPGFDNLTSNTTNFGSALVSDSIENICNLTALNELENNESFIVYPSPVIDEMMVSGIQDTDDEMVITDLAGKEILRKKISGLSSVVTVSLKGISEGLYFVAIHNNGSVRTKQFLKIK
jgi:hypothetical protein